ncbi:MAG: putative manganese transporter [Eubacteriales bacterium]|nr:putative manganese transporter [Eubacteriales bacterium]
MELFFDFLLDALLDTLKMIPFLLVAFFLLEYLEHRASDKLLNLMTRTGRFAPAIGAGLGCLPQCGFSVASAHLYNGGLITAGTLVAVFLSTSDEAVPILLASPEGVGKVWGLIAAKVVIAVAAGFALDAFYKKGRTASDAIPEHEAECHIGSSLKEVVWEAVKRTLSVSLFLFLFTLALNAALHFIGEERLSSILLSKSPLQPFLAALFGFIPNCAASVLLTQLYMTGALSFGSAVAGLSTSAGLGILAFLQSKRGRKEWPVILGYCYAVSAVCGLLLHLVL